MKSCKQILGGAGVDPPDDLTAGPGVHDPDSGISKAAGGLGAKLDQVMEDENGQGVIMGHERITLWKDVKQVRYNPRRTEIKLYHANRIAPMVLRIPHEEYPATETLIKKFCKNK